MYKWPDDLDVKTVFFGRELEAVNFALYSMCLRFGEKFLLSIFSNCTLGIYG